MKQNSPPMTIDNLNWHKVHSSFIEAVAWLPMSKYYKVEHPNVGWLFINIRGTVYTYLCPTWVYGLLHSAASRGKSVGRVYSRVVRGKFTRVPLTAEVSV